MFRMDKTAVVSHIFNEQTFYEAFKKDLRKAKHRIIIESPFITTRRFLAIYPLLKRASKHGVAVVINTRDPARHYAYMRYQAQECVSLLQDIGISILYTVGLHRKLAIIDDIAWEGSLNILSQSNSCEIMRRTKSSEYTKALLKFLKLSKWYNQG